jgi:AcrR family transcriptional regulator
MTVQQKPRGRFHHGDLRRALLDAVAQAALEHGPEAVTLRDCARRAGVAHSAAAPHFGDKRGLLTAFATEGFERLGAAQEAAMAAAPRGARAQLMASGRGYVGFARANPAHFRLMFREALLDGADPALNAAREGAWAPLERSLRAGLPRLDEVALHRRLVLAWSAVHGFAALESEGAHHILHGAETADAAAEACIAAAVSAALRRGG